MAIEVRSVEIWNALDCQESEGKRQGAVVFLHRFPEKAVLPVDHVERTDSLVAERSVSRLM